jgi:hypothetical protein
MIQSVHVISVLTCDVLLACRWNFIAICCVDREFKINSITAVVPSLDSHDGLSLFSVFADFGFSNVRRPRNSTDGLTSSAADIQACCDANLTIFFLNCPISSNALFEFFFSTAQLAPTLDCKHSTRFVAP